MTPPAAAPAVDPRPRGPLTPGRPYSPRPRRVSGPARAPARSPATRRPARTYPGVAIGAIEGLGRLSTHPMLDRLIRGRTWIAIVAFALIGIVTLQLGLLKLNAGIGHALRLQAGLQRENAALSIENSELSAGDVVESRAGRLAMEVVPAGTLRFLTAHRGADASHGAAAIRAPLAGGPAATATPEGSSTELSAEGAKGTSSQEATASSGEPATSPESAAPPSESSEARAPAGESSASRASAEPAAEGRTSPAPAASPSGGGSTEPSGGTQAGSTGR